MTKYYQVQQEKMYNPKTKTFETDFVDVEWFELTKTEFEEATKNGFIWQESKTERILFLEEK